MSSSGANQVSPWLQATRGTVDPFLGANQIVQSVKSYKADFSCCVCEQTSP